MSDILNANGELNRDKLLEYLDTGNKKTDGEGYLGSEVLNFDMGIDQATSTGVFMIDLFLGGGFYPTRVYEISGQNGAGKSTLMYKAFAALQNKKIENGKPLLNQVILIEFESAADKVRARVIGANPDEWIIYPDTPHLEAGFRQLMRQLQKIEELLKQKINIDNVLIFMDTIGAAPTEAEYNYYMGWVDNQYGNGMQDKPRVINGFLRSITRFITKSSRVTLVLGNQIYQGGDNLIPYETPGGEGMKHFCSVRLGLIPTRIEFKQNGTQQIPFGKWVKLVLLKTKQSPPHRTLEAFLDFDHGFDNERTTAQYVISSIPNNKDFFTGRLNYATNGFCSFTVDGQAYSARGMEQVVSILKENPKVNKYFEFMALVTYLGTLDKESSMYIRYKDRLKSAWLEFDQSNIPDDLRDKTEILEVVTTT